VNYSPTNSSSPLGEEVIHMMVDVCGAIQEVRISLRK
jgi:hypothetical protein